MGVRKFVVRKRAVGIDHPEGGKYFLRALSPDKQVQLEELMAEREFVFNDAGELLFDQEGRPLSKSKSNEVVLLRFIASEMIERVEEIDFVDDEDAPIEFDSDETRLQTYEALLMEPYEASVTVTLPGGETKEIKRSRPNYIWVLQQCGKLRKATREVELKNS